MQTLTYKTDKMSWFFILSALRHIQSNEVREPSVDLNLEAPTCIVLSCLAIEAFVNEVSSIASTFLHEQKEDRQLGNSSIPLLEEKSLRQVLEKVATIRYDSNGSFYDRYKKLLCDFNMANPNCLADLSGLGKVRDALVHFRECDVPIVEDKNGVIKEGQELPSELKKMHKRTYQGQQLFAAPVGSPWTLRIATDSMAAWSLGLCLDAIGHIMNELPAGRYKDFVWRAYAYRNNDFDTIFSSGKAKLELWWNRLMDEKRS